MSSSLNFYLPISIQNLELLVESFKKEFDELLKDSFTESELEIFEHKLDSLGALYVQPLIEELSFDDFYSNEEKESEQRAFFLSVKSSLCLENLPFLESNPFQISYLRMLIEKFPQFLVDRGGIQELLFKEEFLKELLKFKSMDELLLVPPAKEEKKTAQKFYPVDPLDFIFVDVIKEIERIRESKIEVDTSTMGESPRKIFEALSREDFDHPIELFKASGLGAKAFDDGLERLKFVLRSFR